MPNHIMNVVTIGGNKESVKKFVDDNINVYVNDDGETAPFSFRTIIPRPKSLDIESSSRLTDAMLLINGTEEEIAKVKARYNLDTEEKYKKLEELGRNALTNKTLYGHTDWYGWSIENWGTKWDCYEVSADCDEKYVSIIFQTAWSTPLPIFTAIAEKYKDLEVYVEFADEDWGCNCGTITFKNGQMVDAEDGDYEFAVRLWGYEPDELELDED